MEIIPLYISLLFGLITLLTVYIFYRASHSRAVVYLLLLWLLVQGGLGFTEFYTVTDGKPPRFVLLIGPTLLTIIVLFSTLKGRQFIDQFNIKILTLLHIVRVPVELMLFWLFLYKMVPQLMTFEGRNLDIIAGVSAPFVYYFGFVKNQLHHTILIVWNVVCMGLLFNIVIHGILSVSSPFQHFAFDQPNVALLYFPFLWLPGCIVPLVLFSHLITLRQILIKKSDCFQSP